MSETNLQRERERELELELEERTKQVFDRSLSEIDAATRSRLTQARYRALQELAPAGARRSSWHWSFAPAGALAAAALVALLLWQTEPATEPTLQAVAAADLEILLAEEELEMLDEELEFYAWLEEQPEFTSPGADGPNATGDGVG
jgi:hypothetical protein